MEYDLHNNIKELVALNPVAVTATVSTAIIDTKGYDSLEFVVAAGVITDGTYVFTLTESDDSGMSGATALPADETLGSVPTLLLSEDQKIQRVGSIGKKRYQQMTITVAGTTTGGVLAVVAILGHPNSKPVA